MRIIKFRAWDKKEKKMCNESLMIGNIGLGEGSVIVTEDVEKGNELIWMQFTGLKDKNGKEIFEGDICHVNENQTEDGCFDMLGAYGEFGIIIFNKDGCFGMELTDTKRIYKIDDEEIEIIGNIYENKELLEEKK